MSHPIKVGVTGAGGRMGRAMVSLALEDARFELVAAHSRAGSEYVGQDAGLLAGRAPCGVQLRDDLDAILGSVDVVVDFTRPEFTLELARKCAEAGCALVSGTTGMTDAERRQLAGAAQRTPVLWAPNMSVGVNLLLAALRHVASRLEDDYDAEIVEAHHRHKVDAPSGTAIALGEVIAEVRGKALDGIVEHGREGRTGPREPGRIGIHAIRGGEIVGEHDVRLISGQEELRLGHTAFRREAFAAGALRAAAWLTGRQPGFYGMRELLELE